MTPITSPLAGSINLVETCRKHWLRLIVPACFVAGATLVYVAVRPNTWEASQALIVRDEAASGSARPGRTSRVEEIKSIQETLLELSKSRSVLSAALSEVGAPAECSDPAAWPTAKDVEGVQDAVKLSPPKGAEFGKTEVFYLKVQSADRERAIRLTSAVYRQLQARLEDLLAAQAKSATHELTKTVSLAQADLDRVTRALTVVEERVGSDLAELRVLNEQPSGNSDLHRTATDLDTELRTQRAAKAANEELLKLLTESQVNAGRLMATPSRLLDSQPALRRLKDGLVDAQLHTATLLGTMTEAHPTVLAARANEEEISQHLHAEIAIAIKGVGVDLRLTVERIASLEEQSKSVHQRLGQLASARAEYANLVFATRHRGDILKTAEQELSAARASEAAAHTASLITAVDRPDTGSRPIGPGRTLIALAGLVGGLLTGVGVVFVTAKPAVTATVAPAAAPVTPTWVGPVAKVEPAVSLTFKQALSKILGQQAAC